MLSHRGLEKAKYNWISQRATNSALQVENTKSKGEGSEMNRDKFLGNMGFDIYTQDSYLQLLC